VYRIVFHPIPEEDYLGGWLDSKPQLFLHLVDTHITAQQQQIFVVLQLVDQIFEMFQKFLGLGLRLIIKKEEDVLGSAHFLLVVVTSQLVELISFLCFAVNLQLVLFGLVYEIFDAFVAVRLRGDVQKIVLAVNRNDVFLVMNSYSPQSCRILRMLSLHKASLTSI